MDLSVALLPHLNATLNGTSAVFLITGYLLSVGNEPHTSAACRRADFQMRLPSYVVLHHTGSRPFPGRAWFVSYTRNLITPLVLAVVILPLVIMTAMRGLRSQFDRHVRIARWTLPLWLYVSVTGVIVYVMLYQLY